MVSLRQTAKALGCDVSYLSKLIDRGIVRRCADGGYSVEQVAIEWAKHLRQSAALKEERRAKVEARAVVKARTDEARAAVLDEKAREAAARADGEALKAKTRARVIADVGKVRARDMAAKADEAERNLADACAGVIEAAQLPAIVTDALDHAKKYLKGQGVKTTSRTVAANLLEGLAVHFENDQDFTISKLINPRRRPASAAQIRAREQDDDDA